MPAGFLRCAAVGAFLAAGLVAAALPVTKISGAEYVRLADVAGALGMREESSPSERIFSLRDGGRRVDFQPEGREIAIDGVRVFLGDPPVLRGSSLYVSRIDFECALAPRLRPALGGPPPSRPLLIVLDPGHGGADHGTENRRLGLMEKTFTLDVALRLRKLLEAAGCRVIMTRDGDYDVSKPLRAEAANRAHADLFVSIHFNSVEPDTKTSGSEIFSFAPATQRSTDSWGRGDERDRMSSPAPGNRNDRWNAVLSHAIYRDLIRTLHTDDHGEKLAHWAVLVSLSCPGVLVESAFLSNDAEARRVRDPAWRQQIASAIADGIRDYGATLDALRPREQKRDKS